MGSFTQLTYHIVFGTKYRNPTIVDEIRTAMYEYMGGILNAKRSHPIMIGGVDDHVHILASLTPTLAVSDQIRDLKASSSKWMNEEHCPNKDFEWQKGYGAFTISYDKIQPVTAYIANQEEHHKERTFEEEYIDFLERHNIAFRPEYLFEDEHHG